MMETVEGSKRCVANGDPNVWTAHKRIERGPKCPRKPCGSKGVTLVPLRLQVTPLTARR